MTTQEVASNVHAIYLGDTGPATALISMHAYVVFDEAQRRALLIDASFTAGMDAVRDLVARGIEPAGLLVTHRHIIGLSNAWNEMRQVLRGKPVLMHPHDAQHEQALRWGSDVVFEDPVGHPLMKEFNLECIHFPGHTAGHVIVEHLPTGVLLVGDCAMTHRAGTPVSTSRPPAPFSVNDQELVQSWRTFHRAPQIIAPFHGIAVVDIDAALARLRASDATSASALVEFQLAQDRADGRTFIKT